MSSEITDILNEFSSTIDLGSAPTSRHGSVRLRGAYGGEGRRQIPSRFLESVTSHMSLTDNSGFFSTGTLFDDIVAPLDLEQEIELQIETVSTEDDSIKHLADFPADDLQVVTEERQYRTLHPPLPKDEIELPPHLNSCIKLFTQDYTTVKRNYESSNVGKVDKEISAKLEKKLPRQTYDRDEEEIPSDDQNEAKNPSPEAKMPSSWASSVVDLKSSQADPMINDLFESIPQEEVDAANFKLRSQARCDNLLGLYSCQNSSDQSPQPFDDLDAAVEYRTLPPPPSEQFGHRLLIKCLSLELEIDVEPIFATIALYDTKARKKISENFHFELNSDATKKLIRSEGAQSHISTLARTAVFSVSNPSHDVFIVVKLEKVLQQGEIAECSEAYMKDATDKMRDKAKQNAKWFCERLKKYRMPFAWTAIHLMNIVNSAKNLRPMEETTASAQHSEDGGPKSSTLEMKRSTSRKSSLSEAELNMLSTFKPVTLTVSSFFKQESEKLKDEDLFKFLVDLKRPSNVLKKLKCIPAKMKIDVSPCPLNFPYCITPDLYQVKPYPDQRGRPTREIQEFLLHRIDTPNTVYRNLLYIYPLNVNFTSRPGGHFRNVAVKVQLLDCEESCNALPKIYGKSNGPEFVSEAYASVTYHDKNPDFYEEVKIELPAKLTSRHHLLFSFYHISCQKKQDLTPVETSIGYTWLSLLHNGRIRSGEISLPVSTDKLPPHYSLQTPDSLSSGIKWVDNHRAVFSINLDVVSTVHTLDPHLQRFFSLCDVIEQPTMLGSYGVKLPDGAVVNDVEMELHRSMVSLPQEASVQSLVRFLYVILNKLTGMLVNPPTIGGQPVNMGQCCFEAITRISQRLHQCQDLASDPHQRNIILSTYVRYLFRIPPYSPNTGEGAESTATFQPSSHYATMTRSERRNRPSITKGTFHISSSNPDLTIPEEPPLSPKSPNEDQVFVRHSVSRSSLTEQTTKHQSEVTGVRSISHKLFHEEVVLLFVVSSGNVKDIALQHSWFIFEMISKAMAEHLHQTDLINASRAQRFPPSYLDDLKRLVKLAAHEIISRFNRDYDWAERLNSSLAFFITDLISIMDRGYVLQLVHVYCQMVNEKIRILLSSSPSSLLMLRITFLRIVCRHEHYITLNLPFSALPPSSPTPSITSTSSSFVSSAVSALPAQFDLSDRFTRQHYLTGLLLGDIRLCLELAENGQSSLGKAMMCALTALRNLLSSHDVDERVNRNPEIKPILASLYFPFLYIAIKALPFAHLFSDNEKSLPMSEDGMISSTVASAIANPISSSNSLNSNGNSLMDAECTKNLLICLLWLLNNTDRDKLRLWWLDLSPTHLVAILDLLHISVSCFEFGAAVETSGLSRNELSRNSLNRGSRTTKDSKSRLQEAILGGSSARQEMLMRRRGADKGATIGGVGAKEGLRWRKDKTEWKQVKHGERMRQIAADSVFSRNLSAETTLIALDALELIIDSATELNDGNNSTSQVLSYSLKLLLHILSKRQSVAVLEHAFAIQRSMVAKFPELIFEEEIEQCADLTLRLLDKCTSHHRKIRMQSAASLYMLMRHNFSMGNSFARVKMQATMSMSSLVGVSHDFDEEYLRRSLKTILSYAEADSELEGTSFPEQVRDLVFNLHMILSDTVKMKEHQEDPEMLIDLMYRIAKGYQNSPDLRLTWLQNMAKQHSERKNHAEAGMCLLHCAALVSEYLSMIEYQSCLPIGCVSFEDITPNILEESAVSEDVVSPNADTICTEKYFSTSGLTAILEQCVHSFTLAGLHEVVDMVYKHILPIYDVKKDYKKLSNIHGKLKESFAKISSQDIQTGWQVGKRMFGTYFRVGFYGTKFGDLNREEFIYKEPAITKLPEISHRLETFYSQCFGESAVEMIKDSSEIDVTTLDPDKAYIQITYVDPYFHQYEDDVKTTYFDRNFNIDKFVYATPFTRDGKAHGEIREQYKRKTFLQVSNTFPYVKTRINVIKRWETVLTPLQSACEDVKKKTAQLLKAVNQTPPDVRMLQVNLQGAVLTSVNQGPMEIANTFLLELPDDSSEWIPYNELRLAFKEFLYACSLALKKNKSLISSDQSEYQREMERNYRRMTERMKQMANGRRVVALIRANHVNKGNGSSGHF